MKYLILLALVSISISDLIQCTQYPGLMIDCSFAYDPVCGFDSKGDKLGTYVNSCIACYYYYLQYYSSDPCIITETAVHQSNTTNSVGMIFKCNTTIKYNCDSVQNDDYSICGLFDEKICMKSPCGQNFQSKCDACSNSNVNRYFYGGCDSEIQNQTIETSKDYVECKDPRPENCTIEFTNTCALTEFPCYSNNCYKEVENQCQACSNQTYIGYVPIKCSEYQSIYYNQNSIKYENCMERSYLQQCDEIDSIVCAQLTFNDTQYDLEFKNKCQACSNTTVTSYYDGNCQISYEEFLSLALFIYMMI